MNIETKLSEDFCDAFDCHSGGCREKCACGRVHFDSFNDWSWDEGELEGLQEKAKNEPDKYIEHDCAVGRYEVGGQLFVYHCPCNGGVKYEQFILSHATQIADYLNRRAKRLTEEAKKAVEFQTVK